MTSQVPVVTKAWLEACWEKQAQVREREACVVRAPGAPAAWRRMAPWQLALGGTPRAVLAAARRASAQAPNTLPRKNGRAAAPPTQPATGPAPQSSHPPRQNPQLPADAYRAGPFTGLVVSSTNFNLPMRQAAEASVARGGGIFTPELQKGVCTHLVCGKPEGQKFK